jgi:hypothetical protein
MAAGLLRASWGSTTRAFDEDPFPLVYDRQIRFVMVDGIAHIPADALDEYQARAS